MSQPNSYQHQHDGRAAALARALMRRWLPIKERRRQRALREAFDAIKEQATKAEYGDFKALLTILNIALYFLIAERDIQSVKIDALTHPDEWTRKVHARVILLTVHEWDMDKVSGAALRDALASVKASDEIRREATEALRTVRLVQRKARKQFGLLRIATIAHRDPNALLQYKMIEELRVEDVFVLLAEFYKASCRYVDLMPRIIMEFSTLPALRQQWMESKQRFHAAGTTN